MKAAVTMAADPTVVAVRTEELRRRIDGLERELARWKDRCDKQEAAVRTEP